MIKSDLKAVKSVANVFLYMDVIETEFSPAIVMHPVFENGYHMAYDEHGNVKMYNVTIEAERKIVQSEIRHLIEDQDSIFGVYMIIRKSYRLTFLKYIINYLSKKDMSTLLADAWTGSENPNQDVNVSLKTIMNWFRKADKRVLMTEEDYEYYLALPEIITVYRGVAEGRNPKGLSWTNNLETARWFANRFSGNGYVQSMTIHKSLVLARFNTRGEDELVIDMSKVEERMIAIYE